MEVMEDGNLMDKVNILIQRDMEYYEAKQSVLQETVCPGIIGGRLDFPRSASFAAIKLVVWWEEEYVAAYRKPSGFFQKNFEEAIQEEEGAAGCGGVVRSSDPVKLITSLSKSANQLLEHLHVLTQAALDHADLTVLTGTIGAAALLKNCLWFYIQILTEIKPLSLTLLQEAYKKYNEMCEALAERLLDLHCRLLSLYIIQDADCLDWENDKAFFESERGSYIIQMWWLYMTGTREDLWNTVPPKMAQRVFSGMLNESLTILTVRYTQSIPSQARSELLLVDLSNLLMCIGELLPSICESFEELTNTNRNNKSKILRDIHVKCQELYTCFLLRAASLDCIFKIFKSKPEDIHLLKSDPARASPWIVFALQNVLSENLDEKLVDQSSVLGIELMVLLAQPQPNWALLLKVLCGGNFKILQIFFKEFRSRLNKDLKRSPSKATDCDNLLCPGDGSCQNMDTTTTTLNENHYFELITSAADVILQVGNDKELKLFFIEEIIKSPDWAKCFERRNVWNLIRPPWYEAILNLVAPILPLIEESVIHALRTGATMYQAMSLIIACLSQYWDVLDGSLIRISTLIQDVIPSHITPVANSVLMQILVSAIYTNLLVNAENNVKKEVHFEIQEGSTLEIVSKKRVESAESINNAALAAAESLCSIDEDNKHTDQIAEFLKEVDERIKDVSIFCNAGSKGATENKQVTEIIVSDLLMSSQGKRSLKNLYHFIKHNSEWLYWKLELDQKPLVATPNKVLSHPQPLLYTMFHIRHRPFDQLLTKQLRPNWQHLLQAPLGLTTEKVWKNLSNRWEFQFGSNLPSEQQEIVDHLTTILKQ